LVTKVVINLLSHNEPRQGCILESIIISSVYNNLRKFCKVLTTIRVFLNAADKLEQDNDN